MRWIYLFVGGLLLMTLAGCASSGVVTHASPLATGIPVSPDFILVETSSSLKGAEAEQQSLNDLIISGLRQTEIFGLVTGNRADTNGGSGMEIKVDIKELKKVSPENRMWFGGLAGHARVAVEVSVSALNSGRQIQTFAIKGESGASARAGTTDAAFQIVAQQVVAEIVRITRQTSD